MRLATEEAMSGGLHRGTDLEELVAEGFLVRSGDAYSVRHPLLRDFLLAEWALRAASAIGVAERLESITNSLTRWGALRAVVEAVLDGAALANAAFDVGAVFAALCSAKLQDQLAEVVAELERPDLAPGQTLGLLLSAEASSWQPASSPR